MTEPTPSSDRQFYAVLSGRSVVFRGAKPPPNPSMVGACGVGMLVCLYFYVAYKKEGGWFDNNFQNSGSGEYPSMRMFQKCEDLFSFSVHSMQDLDCLDQVPFVPAKGERQTGVDEQELTAAVPATRSVKKLLPNHEISFEKDMLKEHRVVFTNEYRNYIEYEQGQIEGRGSLPQEGTGLDAVGGRMLLGVEEMLEGRMQGLETDVKRQFAKDLEHQSNLRLFLDFVCHSCHSQTAERLIILARQVWNAFVPYQNSHFDITDLMDLAELTANTALQTIHTLLPVSQTPTQRGGSLKFRKFIEIYCTTVILVITEYFENPYFVEETGQRHVKRPLAFDFSDSEDSEESFSPLLVKKRKMSGLFLNK